LGSLEREGEGGRGGGVARGEGEELGERKTAHFCYHMRSCRSFRHPVFSEAHESESGLETFILTSLWVGMGRAQKSNIP
jgi:hypothetical protein